MMTPREDEPIDAGSHGNVHDLLLSWTGELPLAKRLRLRIRLRRDPEACEVAETLALIELAMPSARRPAGMHPFVFGGSIAAACLVIVGLGVGVVWRPTASDGPQTTTTSSALHESSQRLLNGSRPAAPPQSFVLHDEQPAADRTTTATALPPWTSWQVTATRTTTRTANRTSEQESSG